MEGKPLVAPPEFGDRVRDTDKTPYWIPGAFPTIFQNETGDPYNYVHKEVDLEMWGPHVMRSKGWHAQAHMTFMYWWTNMLHRMKALSAKKWFVRDNPEATGYTAEDLKKMNVKTLSKQMVGYTAQIPGSKASKAKLRKLILAMVRQIEIETRDDGTGSAPPHPGDVPCLFGTLTTQRYHWDEIIRIIAAVEGIADHRALSKSKRRELVNKYPLFVAWYCSVRLELTLKTVVVPIFGAHDYVGVYEWSPTGGMAHLHYVLWKARAPRFDVRAEKLLEQAEALRKSGMVGSGSVDCHISDVVDFFSEYISEWNPNKDGHGAEKKDHVAEDVNEEQPHTASYSIEQMLDILRQENEDARMKYYERAVRTEHIHDYHYPDPLGPPNPSQPCAKLLKGTLNMWYCSNGYPRDLVLEPQEQTVAQDALRPDLWRVNLCRNCQLTNPHMPLLAFAMQSNSDATPVATKHQSEMYCCKYCSKHGKRLGQRNVLFEVLDDMERKDQGAKEKYGDAFQESQLGTKLHRAFMAEVGEEVCQAEVAHHANKSPEYLCSRPEKHVHVYKKLLAIDTERTGKKKQKRKAEVEDDWWAAGGDEADQPARPQYTKPSDLELYERRTQYGFADFTPICEDLPAYCEGSTPWEQAQNLSMFDFFRFVQFKGGRNPTLAWHPKDKRPIVTIAPSARLREGADFAFGARWALLQYHPWIQRSRFLDLNDAEVQHYFRQWVGVAELETGRQMPTCPWYVRQQYLEENARAGRMAADPLRKRTSAAAAAAGVVADLAHGTSAAAPETTPGEQEEDWWRQDSETAASSSEGEQKSSADTRIIKLLYQGGVQDLSRKEEQVRKGGVSNTRKHDFYRHTRCTSLAQEEQSALPAGVMNVNEDSDDDEAYLGDQKELEKEMDELRAAKHWVNQKGWDTEGDALTTSPSTGRKINLRLDWGAVQKKLAQGAGADTSGSAQQLQEDVVLRDFSLDALDPTQRAFADRVLKWVAEVARVYKEVRDTGARRDTPQLRSWLGGSAGSGKSTTLKTIVQHARLHFQREGLDGIAEIQLTAYTGVAAFNIGFGARTACGAFQIFPNAAWKEELEGDRFKKLEEQWGNVVLLIVDEVSFIGRAFFARMHWRLQQAKRRFFAERALDPGKHTFGGISIILVGDFGQLEPIDDWSMCDTESTPRDAPKSRRRWWKHAYKGKQLLETFDEAVMLKKIHRSKDDMWWTESCLRLRDFACTKEGDYDWWREHDLDRGHFTEEQRQYFENEAVWLCARCEDVGLRNGRKLAHMAEDQKQVIHQIHAEHSSKAARKLGATAFDGLRSVTNLVRGCKVMLTRNIAYLYGLANGTRGKLVGVVYGPGGIGTFPEALIVEVPEYCGPAFYPDEPKWVPILPMTSVKEGTRYLRTQFPVVAGFALTVNKAQGLTIKEGVVIHLVGSKNFRPAAKHGLSFVAFTRSENFDMTAFKNLPPWQDFVKGKDSNMLRMRTAFVKKLEALHEQTLAKHTDMKTASQEQAAHEHWDAQQALKPKRRKQQGPLRPCPSCRGVDAADASGSAVEAT